MVSTRGFQAVTHPS